MSQYSLIKNYSSLLSLGLLLVISFILVILESLLGEHFGLIGLGGVIVICYFILSILKPVLIIYFAILFSGLSGSLSLLGTNYIPISLSGLLTIILIGNASIAILSRIKYKPWIDSIKAYWHFYPFLLIVLLRAISGQFIFDGIRIFFLFLTPILIGIVARREIFRSTEIRKRIEKALLFIPILPISIILINVITGQLQTSGLGFRTAFGLGLGPRPLALFLLPLLALLIGKWRYSRKTKEKPFIIVWSIAIVVIIVTSLSRVATVIALVLIIPSRFIKRWYHPATFLTAIIGLGLLFYWLSLPSVQGRFFPEGIGSFKFDISSLQSIDTQGRRNLWALTWNNAIESPIFGGGTGSSGRLVNSIYPPLEHPHNDYLRVFHDLGIFGLFAFIFAWSYQIYHNWRYWIIIDKKRNYLAYYHLAALIATIAICISFLTDNTITYVFVLIPLNVIYGLADSVNNNKGYQYPS